MASRACATADNRLKGIREALQERVSADSNCETFCIRTYFDTTSSSDTFTKLVALHTQSTSEGFQAYLTALDDERCKNLTREELLSEALKDTHPVEHDGFCFFADHQSFVDETLLCVNLARVDPDAITTFRVLPTETWAPQNNLSIGNMDFEDFAQALDAAGVFRGFQDPLEDVGVPTTSNISVPSSKTVPAKAAHPKDGKLGGEKFDADKPCDKFGGDKPSPGDKAGVVPSTKDPSPKEPDNSKDKCKNTATSVATNVFNQRQPTATTAERKESFAQQQLQKH